MQGGQGDAPAPGFVRSSQKLESVGATTVVHPASTRFKSAGVQDVAAYRPPAAPAAPQQRSHWVNYGIAADNVGFRLLKRAGWREGTGLGASKQGNK